MKIGIYGYLLGYLRRILFEKWRSWNFQGIFFIVSMIFPGCPLQGDCLHCNHKIEVLTCPSYLDFLIFTDGCDDNPVNGE